MKKYKGKGKRFELHALPKKAHGVRKCMKKRLNIISQWENAYLRDNTACLLR